MSAQSGESVLDGRRPADQELAQSAVVTTDPGHQSPAHLSDETTTVGLAALFVICSGAAWGFLLVQFVNFFVQPELNTLHEQIAGAGFF